MIKTRVLASELLHDRGSVLPSRGFEWTVVALSTWLMAGAYLDAWAHRHLARLETFNTPWHAVLYSGMLALLIFLATTALRNQARGSEPDRMLPTGYGLSLVGCALFGFGGVIDMFWHLRFGIEVSLQALISPPHLLLMSAVALIGGLLADVVIRWLRPGPQRIIPLRVASFIGPVGVSSLYLLALQMTRGINWPFNLWLGSILVSGAIGFLLSYLAVQPERPDLLSEGRQ